MSIFQRAWSLVQDGDVIPALTLLRHDHTKPLASLYLDQLAQLYPHQFGASIEKAYNPDEYHVPTMPDERNNLRFKAIANAIKLLPANSRVLDFGCAFGVFTLDLAATFPLVTFVGVDISAKNIEYAKSFAAARSLRNVTFMQGAQWNLPRDQRFQAVIATEVLEHTEKPWDVLNQLATVAPGGKMIITVPQGPWEPEGWKTNNHERWHLWHLDYIAMQDMLHQQRDLIMNEAVLEFDSNYRRPKGHLFAVYTISPTAALPIDPIVKAWRATPRPVIGLDIQRPGPVMPLVEKVAEHVQVIRYDEGLPDDQEQLWTLPGQLMLVPRTTPLDECSHILITSAPKLVPYKVSSPLTHYACEGPDVTWVINDEHGLTTLDSTLTAFSAQIHDWHHEA